MPAFGRRMFCACGGLAVLAGRAEAQPASAGPPDPALLDDLVAANHILFDQGVVDGFGHVSARHDKDPARFLLSRSMAPALVAAADIMEYDLDGTPAPGVGRRAVQVVFHDVGRRPTPGAARSIWSGSSTAKSTANGRTG